MIPINLINKTKLKYDLEIEVGDEFCVINMTLVFNNDVIRDENYLETYVKKIYDKSDCHYYCHCTKSDFYNCNPSNLVSKA